MNTVKRSFFLSRYLPVGFCLLPLRCPPRSGAAGDDEPNVADEKELMKLPALNAALVKGIVERRPFANMMELHKFLSQSLDGKQLNELYTKMFLPSISTRRRAKRSC